MEGKEGLPVQGSGCLACPLIASSSFDADEVEWGFHLSQQPADLDLLDLKRKDKKAECTSAIAGLLPTELANEVMQHLLTKPKSDIAVPAVSFPIFTATRS